MELNRKLMATLESAFDAAESFAVDSADFADIDSLIDSLDWIPEIDFSEGEF